MTSCAPLNTSQTFCTVSRRSPIVSMRSRWRKLWWHLDCRLPMASCGRNDWPPLSVIAQTSTANPSRESGCLNQCRESSPCVTAGARGPRPSPPRQLVPVPLIATSPSRSLPSRPEHGALLETAAAIRSPQTAGEIRELCGLMRGDSGAAASSASVEICSSQEVLSSPSPAHDPDDVDTWIMVMYRPCLQTLGPTVFWLPSGAQATSSLMTYPTLVVRTQSHNVPPEAKKPKHTRPTMPAIKTFFLSSMGTSEQALVARS